ncbi:MAG: NAD(P)(+) transhydrogenase (Re/Si-specific) subunit alpha, partial [Pseudomonadales bacterium]|nr:NAD(P)(+) transhydrogenase (Re/Si-specific) subunit alpha [Pseudomonadales bacterium]
MLIGVAREQLDGENRTALIPANVQKLVRAGAEVLIEAGSGLGAGYADAEYEAAGARISADRRDVLSRADLVLRLHKPSIDEVAMLKRGAIHVSYLDPFNEAALIDAFATAGVSSISMEMIPRTTRSQKMDALSSQANLAGYVMVLMATTRLPRILPMMMTPAGTLKPAHVFVIGAGVAGLQAIATARRLGAVVTATDVRAA